MDACHQRLHGIPYAQHERGFWVRFEDIVCSVLKLIAMQLDACGVCSRCPSVCQDRWGRVCMQLLGV